MSKRHAVYSILAVGLRRFGRDISVLFSQLPLRPPPTARVLYAYLILDAKVQRDAKGVLCA